MLQTNYEYNDVRVNLLAYSLLQVWRKPLPVVFKEKIMDPIGASTTWRWFGYENSFVCVRVESPGVLNDQSVNYGLGLKNLNERLGLQFHNKARFSITQQNSKTVLATIMMPAA